MRKIFNQILLILVLIISINSIQGQTKNPEFFTELLYQISSSRDFQKYTDTCNLLDSTVTCFMIDSIYFSQNAYQDDKNSIFIANSKEQVFFNGFNSWFAITSMQTDTNILRLNFEVNSFVKKNNAVYKIGHVDFIKSNNNYLIDSIHFLRSTFTIINKFSFEHCLDKILHCSDNTWDNSYTENSFQGNWYAMIDDDYIEMFISQDSILYYSYNLTGIASIRPYYLDNDSILIVGCEENQNQFKLKQPNRDSLLLIFDSKHINSFGRLPDNEFKISDVRCWGVELKEYKCFIDSDDSQRLSEEFNKRALIKYDTK